MRAVSLTVRCQLLTASADVEHSGATPDSRPRKGLPELYQGFEPSPYNDLNDNRGELISQARAIFRTACRRTHALLSR